MKHSKHILATASAVALALAMNTAPALAADYTAFSTEELAAMRGTMGGTTAEEREAFRSEWHNRVSSMDPEQRQQYGGARGMGIHEGSGLRNGSGPRGSMGMGSGLGGGVRHRGGR